jgi:hypothetical protein
LPAHYPWLPRLPQLSVLVLRLPLVQELPLVSGLLSRVVLVPPLLLVVLPPLAL